MLDAKSFGEKLRNHRKNLSMTQEEVASRVGVSPQAVSKWETGRSLPDSSIMLDLCGLLSITVNDLLSGEVVSMENYNKELEKNLLEMKKQKEEADRRTVHSSSLANEHLQDTFPPSPRKKIKTKHITLRFKIVHITNTEMQRMLFLLPVRKTCTSI